MKKTFILIPILFSLISCEKFEDELLMEKEILEEEVNQINSFSDFFIGSWELEKLWYDAPDPSLDGRLEDGHSVQCHGKTLAGVGCRNITLNKSGYCYLHESQRPVIQTTMRTREDAVNYLKSKQEQIFDFIIDKENDTTHYFIQKICYELNWDGEEKPFYALQLTDGGILQFGGRRLDNQHTPLYNSWDLWIDNLFSHHDYNIKHSYYGYGYETIVLNWGGYKLFYIKKQ